MNIARRLLSFLLILLAATICFAQQGQPPTDLKENELEPIMDYHFIFDRYNATTTLKSRTQSLEGLAQLLHTATGMVVYIVSSGGRISYPGEAMERSNTLKKYLVEVGKVKAERIEVIDGGYCNEWEIYLWRGVKVPPHLKPSGLCNVSPKEVKMITKRRYLRMTARTIKPASNNSLNRTHN